jgi:hypothetical protein
MSSIYEHFAKKTDAPVRLQEIQQFILAKGVVSEIIRHECVTKNSLVGIFHKYYDLAPPYAERPLIVRIGYPKNASDGAQRLVQTKEMLHALDRHEACSPTRDDVDKLIDDLLFEAAEREIGLPAAVDHLTFINALCVLVPLAYLDVIRPAYKAGKISVEQIAEEVKVPPPFVAATLTDDWRKIAERIV